MTPYHHGDLRRALIDGALRQIGARGIGGWSLREAAAEAGVSHAAPYHHFRDRDDLVAAVARDGLERLDALMADGQRRAGDEPLDQLLAIGLAYVRFAVERPDYFAAIEAAAARTADSARLPASARSASTRATAWPRRSAPREGGQPCATAPAAGPTWMRLIAAVEASQRAGRLPAGDPTIVAVSLWSLVHGLAELWKTGPLARLPQASGGLLPLAERVLRASVASMRLPAGGRVAHDSRDSVLGRRPSAVSRQPKSKSKSKSKRGSQ